MSLTQTIQHRSLTLECAPTAASDTNTRKRAIFLDFFRRTGVSDHFHWKGMNQDLMSRGTEIIRTWNTGLSDKHIEKYLTVGLVIAITGYGHTPLDVQLVIGLYTFCATITDDTVMPNEVIRECAPRLLTGQPQLHPILTHLVEYTLIFRKYYSSFNANAIAVSTIDFLNAEMFNRDEGGSELRLAVREAAQYVDYMRWKTGVGEAYAAMIWPQTMFPETKNYIQAMPDAVQFICLCNDLLSYHKEDKAGETDNYVSQRTAVFGRTDLDTLSETVDRLADLDRKIKAVLGDTAEKRAWESFAGGYVEFHLYTPRYFLKEVLPEYY